MEQREPKKIQEPEEQREPMSEKDKTSKVLKTLEKQIGRTELRIGGLPRKSVEKTAARPPAT